MARKPRDYDGELQALMDKARKVKSQKTVQLGELVQATGADALPMKMLAGVLLEAVSQSKQPDAVARWAERGQAFFQNGSKRGKKQAPGHPADGAASLDPAAMATNSAAKPA